MSISGSHSDCTAAPSRGLGLPAGPKVTEGEADSGLCPQEPPETSWRGMSTHNISQLVRNTQITYFKGKGRKRVGGNFLADPTPTRDCNLLHDTSISLDLLVMLEVMFMYTSLNLLAMLEVTLHV